MAAFATFDHQGIDFAKAVADTLHNIKTVFLEPSLSRDTVGGVLYQLLVTFCLGTLSTVIGAVLAFFCSLLCARNLAHPACVNIVKSVVAVAQSGPDRAVGADLCGVGRLGQRSGRGGARPSTALPI